jgi:hypothetical protein
MLTLTELMEVLKIRYTPEELPEILGVDAHILVEALEDHIIDNYESIMNQLGEDGYVEDED